MKTWHHHTDLYLDLQSVTDIQQWLSRQQGTLICDATGSLGWEKFFEELADYERTRAAVRSKSKNVQAKMLEVLLPVTLPFAHIHTCCTQIMKEVCGDEQVLPYAAWLVSRGHGRYLQILISERYYNEEEIEYVERLNTPRYSNSVTGRLCKADDPHAVISIPVGTVRNRWTSHFSLKSRIFTADGVARKSSDKKKRIGFDRFLKLLRQRVITAMVKLNVPFERAFHLPKIKRTNQMNRYQKMNVTRINNAIKHIEDALQMEWIALRDGCFLQIEKINDRFMALAHRYMARVKKGSFRYKSSGSRSLSLKFSPWMNVVSIQDNITLLMETFDDELLDFQIHNRFDPDLLEC